MSEAAPAIDEVLRGVSSRPTIDVAVVTPLAMELEALLRQSPGWTAIEARKPLVESCYLVKNDGGATILAAKPVAHGQAHAAALVSQLLREWSPKRILLVGISGGLGHQVGLGDITISESIVDYEKSRVESGQPSNAYRWSVYQPSSELVQEVLHTDRLSWRSRISVTRPDGRPLSPKVMLGAVFSSNKRVETAVERHLLRARWPGVSAIEMEGAGVSAAIAASDLEVPFLLVRCICDLADGVKDDRWRLYAAAAVASFTWSYLATVDPKTRLAPPRRVADSPSSSSVMTVAFTHAAKLALTLGEVRQLALQAGIAWDLLPESVRADPGVAVLQQLSQRTHVALMREIDKLRDGLLDSFSLQPVNRSVIQIGGARVVKTILFLAANPVTSSMAPVRLDEEAREIEQKLNASEHRDSFVLKTKWAVRPDDLQDALLREQPVIVHFSGHGSGVPGIVLHSDADTDFDTDGPWKPVKGATLRDLFAALKDNIRIVVLNACYTEDQARSIVEVVDFVIGMKAAIGDAAARSFAASFYRALGFGRTIQTSFELGVNSLGLKGLVADEHLPFLLVRDGASADVTLVEANGGRGANP
jgi:nucleoside phosphorylase